MRSPSMYDCIRPNQRRPRRLLVHLSNYFINYSRPKTIVSDRGSCFTAQDFRDFLAERNIKHVLIATGSPQANGQVERVNRVLTAILSKLTDNREEKYWYKLLDNVEYSLNNTVSKSTGETPSKLLFGIDQRGTVVDEIKEYLNETINTTRENLAEMRAQAASKIAHSQEYNEKYYNSKRKIPRKYNEGDLVMIRNFNSTPGASKKLLPQFKGPYKIMKELRNDRYIIADVEGFQNSQRAYEGVWEAKNIRPWIVSA
ncbi:Pro-Pol polyprotein [Dufourea novaeangliae]|uniref:Pro-Pol polyprotein n=1 Tax=Dufourea novaeangliae TaxID=178035 RepID=A0A154NW65_DUFNO|nr:Pro-Pol polyprotein [Dufourea novaeangliae]